MQRKNNKRIMICWVLLLIVGFMVGCAEKEKLDPAPEEQMINSRQIIDLKSYFPVIPGMVYSYTGEGMEYAAFTRKITFAEKPYVQFYDNNGGTVSLKIYEVTSQSIKALYSKGESYEEINLIPQLDQLETKERVLLRTPLKIGENWENDTEKREIIAIDEELTVPAGTFYQVVKVKITSLDQEQDQVSYDYFAPNVGLIMSQFISGETEIISRLESFRLGPTSERNQTQIQSQPQSANDGQDTTKNSRQDFELKDPDLALLAYQLEHQLRSSFQTAYESYINMNRLTSSNKQSFDQIITIYQQAISDIAVPELVNEQLERLRQFYQAGEGEVTFPVYEVVEQSKVLEKSNDGTRVSISVVKYFPAREWSGKAYNKTTHLTIELQKVAEHWKVVRVVGE